ncbi:MAG: MOSC N-terminal beta barrel domain-containing protein [Pseudomonadota bacterium]
MTATVERIWRHPIKGHGHESLDAVVLEVGKTMPWDRTWAVAHEMSRADNTQWARCANFSRISKVADLAAISCRLDTAREIVTLSHPKRPDLTFRPEDDTEAFLDWVRPLMPEDRAASARFVRVPGRGMTDSDFPSVTLCNMSSHRAVEQKIGRRLSKRRWRGNIWMDGLGPWEEFEWIDGEVRIGEAVFLVRERTDRCPATGANPETGKRDIDVVGALEDGWGHHDFSVRAEVIKGGRVALGDTAEAL